MTLAQLIKKLEWSGHRQGQGIGPMGCGGDGRSVPACPLCGGLKRPDPGFRDDAVGHQGGCDFLRAEVKRMRRRTVGT